MAAKGGLETHLLWCSAHNCGLKVTVATRKKGEKRVWCELGEAKLLLLPWSLFSPEQYQSEQITCLILIRRVYSCGWASL